MLILLEVSGVLYFLEGDICFCRFESTNQILIRKRIYQSGHELNSVNFKTMKQKSESTMTQFTLSDSTENTILFEYIDMFTR